MKCLKPYTWLNDEMINFYMQMLLERNEKLHYLDPSFPRSHFFSSHFIGKMLEDGSYIYSKIKRWSKKFDIFSLNKIFCPVNISNSHWTLAVVFMDLQEIHYYDSMYVNN
jgi:sentrin-specific protease 1